MSGPGTRIVVGVNGSPHSLNALTFAVAEARLRNVPLTVLHTWDCVAMYEGAWPLPIEGVEKAAASELKAAADRVEMLAPGLEHSEQLVRGRPDVALVAASDGASLVVLGHHEGMSAWLGPVISHVAAAVQCPMIAVSGDVPAHRGRIVVGVDGSPVSSEAVDYAFDQASRWSSPLTAVLAVELGFDAYVPSQELLDQTHERGRRYQSEALSGQQEAYPDVAVSQVLSLDAPLHALRQAAQGAALVVVGSHGRGALRRVALGSVSSSLLRAAPCPVAVVRPRSTASGEDARLSMAKWRSPLVANKSPHLA